MAVSSLNALLSFITLIFLFVYLQMAQKMVRLTTVLMDAEKEWKLLSRTVKRIDKVQYNREDIRMCFCSKSLKLESKCGPAFVIFSFAIANRAKFSVDLCQEIKCGPGFRNLRKRFRISLLFLQWLESYRDEHCWILQSDGFIRMLEDRKTRCLNRMDRITVVMDGCKQRLGR